MISMVGAWFYECTWLKDKHGFLLFSIVFNSGMNALSNSQFMLTFTSGV
jgi:hypothetical protein